MNEDEKWMNPFGQQITTLDMAVEASRNDDGKLFKAIMTTNPTGFQSAFEKAVEVKNPDVITELLARPDVNPAVGFDPLNDAFK